MQIQPALVPTCSFRPPRPLQSHQVFLGFRGGGLPIPAVLCHRLSPRRVSLSLAPSGSWSRRAARLAGSLRGSGNFSHPISSLDRSAVRLELLRGATHSDWRAGGGRGGKQRRRERGAKLGKEGTGEPRPSLPSPLRPFARGSRLRTWPRPPSPAGSVDPAPPSL